MNWRDVTTLANEEMLREQGQEDAFKGVLHLENDKREFLGGIVWFFDEGPFYSHAMDAKDISLTRRIGPCETLERAKAAVMDAIEGKLDISRRAGYQRLDDKQ